MWKVTVKGILAHKIRFLLTGVAVILGVAFISGTLVLTATINKTFDGLFSNVYENTDAVVRQKEAFSGDFGPGSRPHRRLARSPRSGGHRGVAEADGNISGFAYVVDKDDEALNASGQGAPALGFAWSDSQDLNPFHLVDFKGRPARRPRRRTRS